MKNCPEPNQMTNTADGTNDTEHNQRTMDINDDNVLRGEIKRSGPQNWKKNQPVYKRLKGEAFLMLTVKRYIRKLWACDVIHPFVKSPNLEIIQHYFKTMTSWEKRRSFVQVLVHKVYFTTL